MNKKQDNVFRRGEFKSRWDRKGPEAPALDFGTRLCQSLLQPWGKSSVNVSSARKNLFLLCSVNLLKLLLISRALNAYRSYKVKQYWPEALTHLNISVVFKACTCTNTSWCLQYPKKMCICSCMKEKWIKESLLSLCHLLSFYHVL